MENIGYWIQISTKFLSIPITACGFTFTLLQWMMFVMVGCFLLTFLFRLFK